ncbi:helix-turn-helix transcriptional regulator [Actinomadura craniellae]|uniref:helix-turn-helix transcriptional regulator n=1 Tax=Actinomadura craniellae TaxID=2231787 RepID=UPI001314AAE4|nr:LuxR family transcriptional regulator [Actinomadura craniellae]
MFHQTAAGPPVASGTGPGRPSRPGWRGRDRESRTIADLLHAAVEGDRGGVLLVEGRSGVGKSRLLAEAVDSAAEHGFMLLQGAADESSRLRPMEPLMTAVGEPPQTPQTAQVAPYPDIADVRLWLMERLRSRLEERVARGPMLVVLDDLHWADPTALLALRSLVPELASYPLVWTLSRTTGDDPGDAERLFDFLEAEGATRIALQPLDAAARAEIATDVLGAEPGPDLLTLADEAGGAPYILVELFEGLLDEGAVEIADGRARLTSHQVPQRVQTVVRRRLDKLSPRTRHVLEVAAILGRSFPVDDLADMLSEPASALLPELENAQATGVVVPNGDLLTFRHHLMWRTVAGALSQPTRMALHRRAGEMLLARGGSAIPAAGHLMRYVRPGDTAALAALDQAVQEVLPTSPQTAADLAARAVELTAPTDLERFDRSVTAVYALTAGGRLAEAAELARTALAQTLRPEQAARLRYELAYALMLAGRPADAITEAEQALAEKNISDEIRDLAQYVLFRSVFFAFDHTRGQARAEAVVAAPQDHSQAALTGAYLLLAHIRWTEGKAAEAIAHNRMAVRAAASGPIRAQHAHPALHLGALLTNLRQLDEAETVLRATEDEITALGHTVHAPSPALFRARLRLAASRLDDAAAEAQAGLAMADELGMHTYTLLGITVLAIVAMRRGDLDTAARQAERHDSLYRETQGMMYGSLWSTWAMATVAEAHGDLGKALESTHVFYTDPVRRRWLLITEPNAAPWLTRTALATGHRSAAEAITTTAGELAATNPEFRSLAAAATHAHGILHGDSEALACAATNHLSAWSRASAAEDLGSLLARQDTDRTAAISALEQALDGYRQTGALRDATRARARLRDLGVRHPHSTSTERPDTGWDSLTDTELKVTALVAQGLTNPQIADQMFVSAHTVKFHLRQVFRKLGIASRVELARLATEHHTTDTH